MTKLKIQINKQHKAWLSSDIKAMLEALWPLVLAEFVWLQPLQKCSISLLLTDDEEIAQLKQEFFGKHEATNVLSFPAFEDLADLNHDPDGLLGDIALSYSYLVNESKAQNKSFNDHLTHMILHGLLHLLGLDHMTEEDALEMEQLEIKILAAMNIADPYQVCLH